MKKYLFAILIVLSSTLWGSSIVVVRKSKALIYADYKKKTPIGYVRRGLMLRVGEVPRNIETMYPVLVSGRIAYIHIEDIYLPDEIEEASNRKYYVSRTLHDAYEVRRIEDGSLISANIGPFMAGSDIQTIAQNLGSSSANSKLGLDVDAGLEWRIDRQYGFYTGIKYMHISYEKINFTTLGAKAGLDFHIYNQIKYFFKFNFSAFLSAYGRSKYRTPDSNWSSTKGTTYGVDTNFSYNHSLDKNLGLRWTIGYQHYLVKKIGGSIPGQSDFSISGPYASLVVYWEFY